MPEKQSLCKTCAKADVSCPVYPMEAQTCVEYCDKRAANVRTFETGESPLDSQVAGTHYRKLGDYQPWLVLKHWMTPEELKGAAKMTAITYLCRENDKGGREDIKKAMHTLQIYLEISEEKC